MGLARRRTKVLVLIIAGAMTLLSPVAAHAQRMRCASNSLPSSDKQAAAKQMLRALPRADGQATLESGCWNPDFAYSWFQTPTVTDGDSVRSWWSVQCRRGRQSWSCEAPQKERQLDVTVTLDDGPTKILVTLPEHFSAARARSIVATSTRFSSNPGMPLPECDLSSGKTSASKAVRPRVSKRPFEESDIEIETTNTGTSVEYLDSLRFSFDKEDQPICWNVVVVVT